VNLEIHTLPEQRTEWSDGTRRSKRPKEYDAAVLLDRVSLKLRGRKAKIIFAQEEYFDTVGDLTYSIYSTYSRDFKTGASTSE
jgi:hypothetical protein